MKLIIITSIHEDLAAVSLIMEKAGIDVFSVSDTVGHKTAHHNYLPGNWFGKNAEDTRALFFFSFTEDEKSYRAIELVKQHNAESHTAFPIRAVVLPIECSSY